MPIDVLRQQRQAVLELAARHGVRNVRVFGSNARGEDRPDSDLDLLVDVEPGRTLLDLIAFEQDLEELLARPVDVLTDGGLSPYLQKRILAEAAVL
ncbi:MAG: nucleotidyltransferase family protein [Acidobacteria bacterium]|nr:nucleotidyltransferase family protein [Acidobacteriota bacterium]